MDDYHPDYEAMLPKTPKAKSNFDLFRQPSNYHKPKKRLRGPTTAQKRRMRATLLAVDPHCKYCGHSLSMVTATLDHVIPKSRGGSNTIENMVLACYCCNTKKGNSIY